jgi:hypothetical protein
VATIVIVALLALMPGPGQPSISAKVRVHDESRRESRPHPLYEHIPNQAHKILLLTLLLN